MLGIMGGIDVAVRACELHPGFPLSLSRVMPATLVTPRGACQPPVFLRKSYRTNLTRQSTEFAQWWPQREVARPLAGQKRINHPTAGQMLFEYSSLGVGDLPDMKLIIFTPLDNSSKKLEQLLRDRPR
jgi:hypothetical protein